MIDGPVVVGVDGSPGGREALEWAWRAAVRLGLRLRAVTAYPVDDYWTDALLLDAGRVDTLRSDTALRLAALLDEVRAAAGPAGDALQLQSSVVAGAPAEHLVRLSEGAALLVVGSRGRGGVRSTLLGSVALHCASAAACPVVIVHPAPVPPALPPGAQAFPPRVVVGLDDAETSQVALTTAVALADELGADVEAVVAVPPPAHWSEVGVVVALVDLREQARTMALARVAELPAEVAAEDRSPVRVLTADGPAGAVLVARSVGAAVLVVGSRSRSRLPGMLLGSVALHCAVHAACPVLVVHLESPDSVVR